MTTAHEAFDAFLDEKDSETARTYRVAVGLLKRGTEEYCLTGCGGCFRGPGIGCRCACAACKNSRKRIDPIGQGEELTVDFFAATRCRTAIDVARQLARETGHFANAGRTAPRAAHGEGAARIMRDTLGSFHTFCEGRYLSCDRPKMKVASSRGSSKRALKRRELSEVLRLVRDDPAFDGPLTGLIFQTAYESGARRQGLLTLTRDRIHVAAAELVLTEKGKTIAPVPASRDLIEALIVFDGSRPAGPQGDSRVFRHPEGRPIGRKFFEEVIPMVHARLAWADEMHFTCHDLRRTAGTEIERVSSLAVARTFLRHAEPRHDDVTGLYVEATPKEVRRAQRARLGLDRNDRRIPYDRSFGGRVRTCLSLLKG